MTFEDWWDNTKPWATPETFDGWEHSCRQAWQTAQIVERAKFDDGDLWSFLRTVMAQGAEIALTAERSQWPYEYRSAMLDAAAAERTDEMLERLKGPNVGSNRPWPQQEQR